MGEVPLRRTLGFISGAIVGAALLGGCGKTYPVGAVAPTPTPVVPSVTSVYPLPTPPTSAQPEGLASAPLDSNCATGVIWFAEENNNSIGTLNEAAKFTTFQLPNASSEPYGITCGPDGEIWFTEFAGNRIGRFSTATLDFAEYNLLSANAQPTAIALGNDGGLWFTESNVGNIGRVDETSGVVTEYPTGGTDPFDAILGPDGNIWFTLRGSDQIATTTYGGSVTRYNVPTGAAQPYAIVVGADGALWFTENAAGKLGRVVASNGNMSEVTLTSCANPTALQQGIDGDFYIVCSGGTPTILQYDPSTGNQKSFPVKTGSVPQWAIVAFDNKLYFTDSGLNSIDQFTYI